MKKILVPTDFNQGSLNAYTYALRLANELGAKVTLYHVYNEETRNKHVPERIYRALEKKEEESALQALEEYGRSIQEEIGLEVASTYIMEEGKPVKCIVEYADFMEADLIVMGTWKAKGASGIVDTWLGHAGTKVVAQTNRPVLLIPNTVKFKRLKHVAYGTNFREKEQRIPVELVDLSHTFDLDLSCLHVKRPGTKYNEIQYAFLKEMYRMELDNFNIYFYTLTGENPIESLQSFVEKEEVDILAMLTHDKMTIFERLLGPDIPQQMAFQSRIPLLILHQAYEI